MPGFIIKGPDGNATIQPKATQETARAHRWRFRFISVPDSSAPTPGLGFDSEQFSKKGGRPQHEFDDATVHHMHEEMYFPSKGRWSPIEFTFYERLDGNRHLARDMWRWWALWVYNIRRSGFRPLPQFKATILYSLLDGQGNSQWDYYLLGAWPMKINPSDFDHTSSDIGELTVTVKFDKAVEKSFSAADDI
jgi:hypothetical protein